MTTKSNPPLLRPPKIEIWHERPCSAQGRFYLEDHYEIEGFFDDNWYPYFKETEGRLETYARKIGKSLMEVHVFPETKELCLGHPVSIQAIMEQKISIQKFFERLLIPHLYYHSYWQKYGVEPWRGLNHGDAGILEGLSDLKNELNNLNSIRLSYAHVSKQIQLKICQCLVSGLEIKRNNTCFCGSGEKVKDCCKDRAMRGFNLLLKAIKRKGFISPFETLVPIIPVD
ncbi:MAG: hypothetical protein OXE97_09360 [Gammaproteobacteria bacterium]|nr:hypothetical protein [Gammaproteobacteria bacterium]MCY4281882.1 hypothetical protein [Gammaproteobacteria bacterium]